VLWDSAGDVGFLKGLINSQCFNSDHYYNDAFWEDDPSPRQLSLHLPCAHLHGDLLGLNMKVNKEMKGVSSKPPLDTNTPKCVRYLLEGRAAERINFHWVASVSKKCATVHKWEQGAWRCNKAKGV
jgi:hypothetical protein